MDDSYGGLMTDSDDRDTISRRRLLGYGVGAAGASLLAPGLLTACGSSSSSKTTASSAPSTTSGQSGTDAKLLSAARAEGTVIACAVGTPHSYYVPVIDAFEKYAGFAMDLPHPTYPAPAQVEELAKARTLRKPPPYDVIEVTQSTATDATNQDLLEPYVSTLWADIPSAFKDPQGAWSAAYFGLVSFVVNTSVTKGYVPASWKELRDSPDTPRSSFAMLGDPRTGKPFEGGLALLTVMSAALANQGSLDDVEPGLALLGELVEKKIFDLSDPSSLLALPDTVGDDATPINALFSFDLPLSKWSGQQAGGKTVALAAPNDGLIGGFYPQAIAAGAQNPSAAKLWIEFIQSDRGAELFATNGAIPTRHQAIRDSVTAPESLKKALPPVNELQASFPTPAQLVAAQAIVDKKWTKYVPTQD